MQLNVVRPERVALEWPGLAPWLAPVAAREGCDLSLDDMRALSERMHAALVVVVDDEGHATAAGVIQPRDYEADRRREMWILSLGGVRCAPWRDVMAEVERLARETGCARVCFVGRAAWRRLLPNYRAEPCERGTFYSRDVRH